MNKNIENKLIPKLRFPEFVNESDWKEDTLINLAEFRRGSFPQPYGLPKWYDEINGMPFIQVYDVGEDFRLKAKTKNKISDLAAEQSVFIPKGTVIITIQGSIGRVAITQYDAYIDRTLLLFEKFHFELDKTFFAYAIYLLFEIEKKKAPGGIIKTITKEVLSKFVVKIPKLKEQEKIANCLSSLDEVITAESQKLEVLKEHKKGLLQNLFPQEGETVPKLRFKEFEDSGEWVQKTIGDFAPLQRGFDLPVNDIILGEFPVVFSNGILKYHKEFKVKAPGVVTGRSGTIGKVTFVEKDFWPHNTSLWVTDFCGNFPLFVYYYFIRIGLEQFSAGGGVPTLNRNDVHRHKIIIPSSYKEQQKIASTLSSLDDLITAQSQKIEALQLHKKGLLQGLFPNVNPSNSRGLESGANSTR